MTNMKPIPAFLENKEPPAVYMWVSTRRMIVQKGDDQIDLSGDDLRALIRFINQFDREEER